tara:strand:- start:1321 stop:1659 length:339 start_codon:yes stop_codon:yes gene_type:complete
MKKGESIVYTWWVWMACDGPDDRSGGFDEHETYAEAHRHCNYAEGEFIELVRSYWGDEDDGLLDRDYATVEDGKLPECYDMGSKPIAKKLHAEVKAAHAEQHVPYLEAFFKL